MQFTPFLSGPPATAVGRAVAIGEQQVILTSAVADDAPQLAWRLSDDRLPALLGRSAKVCSAEETAGWIARCDRLGAHLLIARADGTAPVGFATVHLDAHDRAA